MILTVASLFFSLVIIKSNTQVPVYETDHVNIRVPIMKCYAGVSRDLFDYLVQSGSRAIVLEGYGTGNIPYYLSDPVRQAVEEGIIIVVTTRCVDGESYACYNYVGGGAQLEEYGVILSGTMNAIKSRILLIAMLSVGKSVEEIRRAFQ